MTADASRKKRPAYGLFALAAIAYALGVVAFSAWSYFEQRAMLLAHIDESMFNATHATEQIIGNIFIECAVATESVHQPGYLTNQSELNRFAEACRFDIAMAVAVKGTNLWTIVGGVDRNGIIPPVEAQFKDPIHSKVLAKNLRSMAAAGNDDLRVFNLHHEPYGWLRLAVRYRPTTDDTGYALVVVRNIGQLETLMQRQAFRETGTGLFLLAMAFPLLALYTRARIRSTRELTDLNRRLQEDVEARKQREAELKDAIEDLERFNALAVGREGRMIELKAEVNTLLEQAGHPKRYNVDHVE